MNRKNLVKLCLSISLLGILFLITANIFSSPKLVDINSIGSRPDSYVAVQGAVARVGGTEKVTFIDLQNNGRLKVVAFGEVDLQEGDFVQIAGRVKEYRGEVELIADEIILLGVAE